VWIVWLLFGLATVAVFETYWRLPPAQLWKVSNSGFVGGIGRALVFLSFSAALAAVAVLPIVVDRLESRWSVVVGIVSAALCATVAWPGVQTEGDLDPKWSNGGTPLSTDFHGCVVTYSQVAANPDLYFYPDQYNNDANWRAHYETTGPEILAQTEGRITHFVAGLGTSGTFMGTGRRLREANPSIKLISFQPDSPLHGLEGLKHMESAIVPGIYDPALADEDLRVSTEDAYELVRRLAREEGLLVGISGGAALAAALKVARQSRNAVVVTVFPDSADKYMSERFWNAPV